MSRPDVRRVFAFRHAITLLAAAVGVACISACVVVQNIFGPIVAEIGGGDSSCDRRFGSAPERQPFCQELVSSVAGSQFRDDCTNHLHGKATEDLCPRAGTIAGCKIDKVNDDGSDVIDWFYEMSTMGDAAKLVPAGSEVVTKDDVRKKCTDKKRYEDGAHFIEPEK